MIRSYLSTFGTLHYKIKIYIACVHVHIAAIIQSKYLICDGLNIKLFLFLMHLGLLHTFKCEQLEKILRICQDFFFFLSKCKHSVTYHWQMRKFYRHFLPNPKSLTSSILCKGTSSSFFTCCTDNKIFNCPEQKSLKDIRGNLKHLAVWPKKKGQWHRIQIRVKNWASQCTAHEL